MRQAGAPRARSLSHHVERYLLRCEVEAKSADTLRAYRSVLERFARILADDGAPDVIDEITDEHVLDYLGRFTHLSMDTRHRYFREVRCFFNWLVAKGELEDNPFRGMANVQRPQLIKQPFSADEITALLAACGDPESDAGLRDRAMVLTLLDTGVRCTELARVRLADLDLKAGRMLVNGKGNRQRVVAFADRSREALRAYLTRRGREAGPLFVAVSRHRELQASVALRTNGVKQMLRRLGKRSKVSKVHAHRFRHTFATWAIQTGAREIDVQYLLGHSTGDMVRRYSSSYRSEQAAMRHVEFSPGDQMLEDVTEDDVSAAAARLTPPEPDRPATSPSIPPAIAPRFEAGQRLVARYKGKQYTCEVGERDGLVYVLPGGYALTSPSAAGRAITGSNVNGYRFWSVADDAIDEQAA
jgi:integrase/recombinase XerC/integrase/recombinase XerD